MSSEAIKDVIRQELANCDVDIEVGEAMNGSIHTCLRRSYSIEPWFFEYPGILTELGPRDLELGKTTAQHYHQEIAQAKASLREAALPHEVLRSVVKKHSVLKPMAVRREIEEQVFPNGWANISATVAEYKNLEALNLVGRAKPSQSSDETNRIAKIAASVDFGAARVSSVIFRAEKIPYPLVLFPQTAQLLTQILIEQGAIQETIVESISHRPAVTAYLNTQGKSTVFGVKLVVRIAGLGDPLTIDGHAIKNGKWVFFDRELQQAVAEARILSRQPWSKSKRGLDNELLIENLHKLSGDTDLHDHLWPSPLADDPSPPNQGLDWSMGGIVLRSGLGHILKCVRKNKKRTHIITQSILIGLGSVALYTYPNAKAGLALIAALIATEWGLRKYVRHCVQQLPLINQIPSEFWDSQPQRACIKPNQ